MEKHFRKYNSTSFNIPYDFQSIMHYSITAFSKDKISRTIEPRVSYNIFYYIFSIELKASFRKQISADAASMGQRFALSDKDILKLNSMYKCEPVPGPHDHSGIKFSRLSPCRSVILASFILIVLSLSYYINV